MMMREGEPVTLNGANMFPFEAVCHGYELITKTPQLGETVFTALGSYAIHQPFQEERWQLLSGDEWRNGFRDNQWASAEELRTWAGEDIFSSEHMDLIDASLFHEQRVTNETTRLAITSEDDLRRLLADYAVATDPWSASIRRLYDDIRVGEPFEEVENIALHRVNGELWLATSQTMLNVYHDNQDGNTYKLQETDTIYYDDQGNSQPPVKSKLRSSMGETGHKIGNQPERPFDTARRGLREELGLEDDNDIMRIVSIGSLLRRKENGHHKFRSIKAEDRTHYFRVDLNPQTVRPEYINEEYDANGQLRARIKLEWFMQDSMQ